MPTKTKKSKVAEITINYNKPIPLFDRTLCDGLVSKFIETQKKEYLNKISEQDISTELHAISLLDKKATAYIDCGICINFKSKPVTLKKIRLGSFDCRLRYFDQDDWTLKLAPVRKGNPALPTIKNRNPAYHPNIGSGGGLCLGEGTHSVQNALSQYRFSDVAELINNILHTNSDEPYFHIDNWLGYKCKNCESISKKGLLECVTCLVESCNKCLIKCKNTNCGYSIHEGCEIICVDCKDVCCAECTLSENPKYDDNKELMDGPRYCRDCRMKCNGCAKYFKPNKITKLNNRCEDCQPKHCASCKINFTYNNQKCITCWYKTYG